jgi:flagellar motor switch protein FliM
MSGPDSGEQGDTAETSAPPQEASGPGSIRALDFARPTKFTTELRRRISSSLGACAETLTAMLSNELKVDAELELGAIDQHTWAAARAELPADTLAVAIRTDDEDGPSLLLSIELSWVLQALECLLGGKAAMAPDARRLTDIDRTLVQGLIDIIVGELSKAWAELGGAQLQRGEVDVEGDAGLLVAPGEPTLAATFSSEIDGASSSMALLLPWIAFAPLADAGHGKPARAPQNREARDAEELRRGLTGAQVLLRAEIGSVQMPIERMLELQPGTLVELGERAEDGVMLFAEEVSLGRGRPGRSGAHRAVKLEITGEPPSRAETYAKLGRIELERARAWAEGGREGGPPILRNIFVRVWAELGRTHAALGDALELSQGAVVALDQPVENPVELFANGLCFANGSLVVTPDGTWAVQVGELV